MTTVAKGHTAIDGSYIQLVATVAKCHTARDDSCDSSSHWAL